MLRTRFGLTRRAAALAVAACLASSSVVLAQDAAPAEKPGSAMSFSAGIDFMSHFISYGADVWGGGGDFLPFNSHGTMFGWGQVNAAVSDQFTLYFNAWADINDNSDSDLGGNIQEVDLTLGGTYVMDKFTFGLAAATWNYASDEEIIIDGSVAYNDAELWGDKGFALNPSALVHWRVNGNGAQDEGVALVLGIAPGTKYTPNADYPIAISFPVQVGLFLTDDFQGGDSGLGYVTAGVSGTVPLAFIPAKYGSWTGTVSAKYYYTPEDQIPNNECEHFVVTGLSIGMAF